MYLQNRNSTFTLQKTYFSLTESKKPHFLLYKQDDSSFNRIADQYISHRLKQLSALSGNNVNFMFCHHTLSPFSAVQLLATKRRGLPQGKLICARNGGQEKHAIEYYLNHHKDAPSPAEKLLIAPQYRGLLNPCFTPVSQ